MTEPNKLQDNNRPFEISLDPFYADILSKKFPTSVEAIDYCRKLCATFGFTIKQEQSTYRNIYVYCSREGFPDSLRNPKSNPKRRRPSKRCDCRWRIVLNEQNDMWHFRKSLNPDASKHNHDLMKPEDIDKGWPKEMLDLICELARQRLPTPDIRTRVQLLYAHIPWNERRFYNRLSEERTKQRIRDAETRVQQLTTHWSNVVTVASASQELTEVALMDLRRMVDKLCGMTQTDSSTFPTPQILQDGTGENDNGDQVDNENDDDDDNDDENDDDDSTDDHYDPSSSSQDPIETTGDIPQDESIKPSSSSSSSRKHGNKVSAQQQQQQPDTPKGYTAVKVPQQIYYVKLHPHRILQDVQQLHRRRSRSLAFSDDFNNPTNDDGTIFNNQLKKQKTPMLMEMAQQQQQQQLPPSDILSARHFEPQQQQHFHHPAPPPQPAAPSMNDPLPSSGLMYHHRDANYYPSTSYPVYQQQQQLMPPPPPPPPLPLPPSRYMIDNNRPNMSVYTTGRPPLLTVTPDFQQQQQQQPMTPTPPTPTSTSNRMTQQANISMLSTNDATTPSPKTTDVSLQPAPPPSQQQQQQQPFYDHRAQPSSYRPSYPSLQDDHQQRLYYSNLPPHLLPPTNDNNNNNNSTPPQQSTIYYMKQPHLPPSQ